MGYDVIGDLLANHETADAALKILLIKTVIWVNELSSVEQAKLAAEARHLSTLGTD